MRLRSIAASVLVAGIIGGLIGAGAAQVFDNGRESIVSPPTASNSAADEGSPQVLSLSTDCRSAADLYDRVRPAVVQITVAAGRSGGTGTGIILDMEGRILTNYHVVEGADSIEVRFEDGSTASADLIGSDPANDLALIDAAVSGKDLTTSDLGDSDALRVGDPVLAIGNPFNLEATLTQGIVSAIDRTYSSGANTRPIREMIQTDAAVNPGNSGGPLLNCRGEVIGINSLLENPSGANVNVGVAFAVAINTAKQSLSQMEAGETVSHSWVGRAGGGVA